MKSSVQSSVTSPQSLSRPCRRRGLAGRGAHLPRSVFFFFFFCSSEKKVTIVYGRTVVRDRQASNSCAHDAHIHIGGYLLQRRVLVVRHVLVKPHRDPRSAKPARAELFSSKIIFCRGTAVLSKACCRLACSKHHLSADFGFVDTGNADHCLFAGSSSPRKCRPCSTLSCARL